jgi:hypothetical protein
MQANAARFANVLQRTRIKPHSCVFTNNFSASPDSNDSPKSSLSPVQTSLALSVHFLHPKLGMKDYEILSRATAFLLNVDPPDDSGPSITHAPNKNTTGRQTKSAFPHLATNKAQRDAFLHKQDYAYDPASGPKRHAHQLNWLEFCPTNFRPKVHVVASSHVLSPWRWPQYYGQEWLKEVNEEHVRYSLEVYKNTRGEENDGEEGKLKGTFGPVAKFALNPYPIHHPNGLDVAVIHLKGEDEGKLCWTIMMLWIGWSISILLTSCVQHTALEQMKNMGIRPLNLHTMHDLENSTDPVFEPGEHVFFHGFEVYEANKVDDDTLPRDTNNTSNDDERIFHPYFASGTQSFGSPDRFLAKTSSPLPEGLCGGPVLTTQNDTNQPLFLRGVVEGIVPPNHENAELAGAASFLPAYRVREFVDFAERIMLEQIMEPDMFKRVVDIKEKKAEAHGTVYNENDTKAEDNQDNNDDDEIKDTRILADMEGTSDVEDTPNIDKAYQEIVTSLHKHHTPEEVDAILATVEREKREVLEILETQGGDIDTIIADVRKRTYEERDRVLKELSEQMESGVIEGEVIPKDDKST